MPNVSGPSVGESHDTSNPPGSPVAATGRTATCTGRPVTAARNAAKEPNG